MRLFPISKNKLVNLPVINRLKLLKDHVLAKLDVLEYKVNSLNNRVSNLESNDTSLLEAMNHTVFELVDLGKATESLQNSQNSTKTELSENIVSITEKYEETVSAINALGKSSGAIETQISELAEIKNIQTPNQDTQKLNSLYGQIESIWREINELNRSIKVIQPKLINLAKDDPERRLMAYLYSFLPSLKAIDIGANVGDVSDVLLTTGYEVYAFEPFPTTFERLKERFSGNDKFHPYALALGPGDETKELHIAQDKSDDHIYGDSSLYNSLTKHSLPEDIEFVDSVLVNVRSLESLHKSHDLPEDIGLVKIDTEGFDLAVLQGMGGYRYSVVVAEFWDSKFPFGVSGAFNELESMIQEMRSKGYSWYLIVYRVWGSHNISFYCNCPKSVQESWGNVFFFSNHDIFLKAFDWCSATLQPTYIV